MKVSILLAVYNPNLEWLEQQLNSINNQTYNDIELIICDDCSPKVTFSNIKDLVNKSINRFPIIIYRNDTNLGSTKTFNNMVNKATGDFIAFCDQDDIWENEKISFSVDTMKENNSVLSYCKASVIDENSNIVNSDWNNLRKYANMGDNSNAFKVLLFRNWIAGCFMLVKADIVRKALPFVDNAFYDQWIALVASLEGDFSYINKSLILYRRHTNTQTGSLTGIRKKNDYKIKYIEANLEFIESAIKRLPRNINDVLTEAYEWCNYRKKWWESFNLISLFKLCKGYKFDKKVFLFELFMARMPEKIFNKVVIKISGGE